MKRIRSERDEWNLEHRSKRLRPDLQDSVTARRSVLGRMWDATSGKLRSTYTWLMQKLSVSSASIRQDEISEGLSQNIVFSSADNNDDEKRNAEPWRTLGPQFAVSKPTCRSVAKEGDFANLEKHKRITAGPTTTQQYSGARGDLFQHPILSDVLHSQKMLRYEKLLGPPRLSTHLSVEEVGPACHSPVSADISPSTSGLSQHSLLSSGGIRLLSVNSSDVSSGSSSRRRRVDRHAESALSYSSIPTRTNVPISIPITVTPTLSSITESPKAGPVWADDPSFSHAVTPLTESRRQLLKYSGVGSVRLTATSSCDEGRTVHKPEWTKTASSGSTFAVSSYPSHTSWLEQWKLRHEVEKADYRSRVEAAQKYYDFQHEERMKAEDKRHKNLEGLLKSLQITRLSPTSEEELNLNFTSEQLQQLEQVWNARARMDQVLSEAFNIKITRGDLMTLYQLEWLNDEVINFYLNMIVDEVNSQTQYKIHLFNSFFYTKIMSKGYSGVRRWTKRVDIFSMDMVLLPVHLGMHWCLASIDFRKKEICYFDSLKGNNGACFTVLREYLVSEAKDKKQMVYDVTDWTFIAPKDIPAQYNGSDCGVFTCMYARHKAKNKPFCFTQKDMPQIRIMMVLEIISKQFL